MKPQTAALVLLGHRGTRLLFSVGLASVLLAWGSEALFGLIDPNDRLAYPVLATGFAVLWLALRARPHQLQLWQRCAATLMVMYFVGNLGSYALRPDPGPGLYTLGTQLPWLLGSMLLLFTCWGATSALRLALLALAMAATPATWVRFSANSPEWLLQGWPLLLNGVLACGMFCVALWGLSRQLAVLANLAPTRHAGAVTTAQLVQARLDELETSRQEAEQASRAKSDFLAALGHEIRTPMNTVSVMTQLVLEGRLEGLQREHLLKASQASETLIKLLDRLLDYAALDAGRLSVQTGPLRIEDVIAAAVDPVRLSAQGKHIELLCSIASHPLLGPQGWRQGDAIRLTQILAELLGNAVKFTTHGQVRLSVSLVSEPGAAQPEVLVFNVRDSGIGMSAQQLARLFTPFVQADSSATRRFEGTGLGLAVSQRLATLMGGTLTARSELGRGSEFELQLRLPALADAPVERVPPAQRVLLVQASQTEGHADLLEQLRLLAPAAQVEALGQGAAAMARLRATPVSQPLDLLVIDWVLPDMDGTSLLEQIGAIDGPPRVRRIALLSAFDTPVLRERALRLGADTLLAKPALPPTLRRLLDPLQELPPLHGISADWGASAGEPTDLGALVDALDSLLTDSDSDALALWESHSSEFMEALPAQQVKALAGAMQRLDFDEAHAALRGGAQTHPHAPAHPQTRQEPR